MKQDAVTIGLDLAKHVFQVHAIGGDGVVLIRHKLRRAKVVSFFAGLPACFVGMEACASAHNWARELIALGHEVWTMPLAYVKRGKTDAADAEAIGEAMIYLTRRFVAVRTLDQQDVVMLYQSRSLVVRQRTMLINALKGHPLEYCIVTSVGAGGATTMLKALHERQQELPLHARSVLHGLAAQLRALGSEIDRLDAQTIAWHRSDETNRRFSKTPGISPSTPPAITAAAPDASLLRSGRQFAAWLGLKPRANSSGCKEKPSGITKQGDGYLRRLRVVEATAVLRTACPACGRGSGEALTSRASRAVPGRGRVGPDGAMVLSPLDRAGIRRSNDYMIGRKERSQ